MCVSVGKCVCVCVCVCSLLLGNPNFKDKYLLAQVVYGDYKVQQTTN